GRPTGVQQDELPRRDRPTRESEPRTVDQLPRLAEHLESDVMPILATLDRVGPDMHELLNVVKDLRTALDGVPGLAYLRRRIRPE
ncbi:MAG: hypothetical protein QOC83_7015, partial [Pseudonocardiales bacterium]|nr:hypothetical protein [Pseudonocardiales bacterium]